MDRPLITLAVTCHNQRDVIGDAIAGALSQDYSPLEILVSDDASGDDSLEVICRTVAGYAGPHRITINRNARNRGIAGHYDYISEIAAGELIVCADGDDISLPTRVRRFADAWLASGAVPDARAAMIHGPCLKLDGAGREQAVVRPPPAARTTPAPIAFIDDYLYVMGANFAWTKALHRRFGPLAGHALIDDHVLPFRASLTGGIVYVDEPLVRKRPGGMADLAVAETGYDALFGLHLKELPWKIGDYRQFEADLTHVDRPDRPALLAAARARRARYEMEYRMAKAGGAGRLAMLPGELLRAVRRRDRHWLKRAILYAGAPATTALLDARMRRARTLAPSL